MKVLVLGGDGFCGWPTALHLSRATHDVVIADNLSRRRWDEELAIESLTPIRGLPDRLEAWRELTGCVIPFEQIDLLDADALADLVETHRPEAVVHFAEQSSVPYSMIDREHAVFTQTNNVVGTLNLLFVLANHAPDCHLVKLGTMGEYGTPNIDIEEGFIEVEHNGRRDILPFPKQPGSFYHLSKVHDSHNLAFAARVFGLRVTDLNQGVVYGHVTPETELDPRLVDRFDYDGIFGTVINRFCVQAAAGHPISVYGKGGQTRGFLDLRDTVRCIELAVDSPAGHGEFRVFNQFTGQYSVAELAELVRQAAAGLGLDAAIEHIPNPRVEAEAHYYRPQNRRLLGLGLEPHPLTGEVLQSLLATALEWHDRIDLDAIQPRISWQARSAVAAAERQEG